MLKLFWSKEDSNERWHSEIGIFIDWGKLINMLGQLIYPISYWAWQGRDFFQRELFFWSSFFFICHFTK